MKALSKRMIFRFACLLVALAASAHAERILFIGNSYTAVNKLPEIYRQIAASTGMAAPEVKAITPGGRTLAQHLADARTLKLVDEGKWDAVVIQGQSQEAAMAEGSDVMRDNFLNGAEGLCDRIKAASPDARIVFYETWARHADYWAGPNADLSVGKDPDEMQARIRKWYRKAAGQTKGACVAPVGDAWQLNYQSPHSIRLHKKDNSHPVFSGSYLAGLVLFATIHPSAGPEVPFHGALTAAEASYLQSLAGQAIGKRGNP